MNDFNPEKYGRLVERVDYLVRCCEEVKKDMEASKTRSTATLTTIIILLIGTVVNLILYYAK